jgi:hypothetical protein
VVSHHRPSITCPRCTWTSYNAEDIAAGWCYRCQDVTSAPAHDPAGVVDEGDYPYRCATCRAPLREEPLGTHKVDPAGNAYCPRVDNGGTLTRRVPRTLHTATAP